MSKHWILSLSAALLLGAGRLTGGEGTPPAAPEAQPAAPKVLYDFEESTGGWWTYAGPGSKVAVAQGDGGAEGSAKALKITYEYGKGMTYLGIGVEPKYVLKGQNSLAQFAGGHLSLCLKSTCKGRVGIELRTAEKVNFGFSLPALANVWGKYEIPFSEFKNKDRAFDPATDQVAQLVVVPQKGEGPDQMLWMDNFTFSAQPVTLSGKAPEFVIVGTVTGEGKPLPEVKMSLLPPRGLNPVAEAVSGADGKYTLRYPLTSRKFTVAPAEACPEESEYKGVIATSKAGFAPEFQQTAAKAGTNKADFALKPAATLAELKVSGNRLVDPSGKEVWLQGMCLDSLEWSEVGDNMLTSPLVAIRDWKSNCLRIPMRDTFWFGKGKYQKDGGKSYRELLDKVIELTNANGAYVVFDLHVFGAPMPEHVTFWKDAAEHYKNRPGVLFELFNEPHGISWEVWRNGGSTKEKRKENAVVENNEKNSGDYSPGMQALVEAVRSTGAKNVIIAGGLSWSYDLSGIVNGFALEDKTGNGIMYSHHNYPWKKGWQKAVLDTAEKHPIFVGEVGNIRAWADFPFIKANEQYEDLSKMEWPGDMLGMIQKYRLNWTGFSFHPRCGPMIISDWNYTPTPYWGVFVKEALAGKQFTLNRLR